MRALILATLAAIGCATTHTAATAKAKPILYVRCAVADASVTIDGQLVGDVADLGGGVRIAAGLHRVELAAEGYHTRYAEVTLVPGEKHELQLTMAEALP
jgi:hypothetical protein